MTSGSLSVVIPTTHHVVEVLDLVDRVRSSSPVPVHITIVDNGPGASAQAWRNENVVVKREYLGSEQAFVVGLNAAFRGTRYLLLDHDAVLADETIGALLDLPAEPDVVYSANHGGRGEMWDRVDGWPRRLLPEGSSLLPIELAPWSGLLLPEAGRRVVAEQYSGYFFGWDDYLASWRLRSAGLRIQGVVGAMLGNEGRSGEWLSAWRTYYQARNHVLFYQDTRIGSKARLGELRGKLFAASMARREYERAIGVAVGLVHGLSGCRGMILPPGGRPSSLLAGPARSNIRRLLANC